MFAPSDGLLLNINFFFIQKDLSQFVVIFSTTNDEEGIYNIHNLVFYL